MWFNPFIKMILKSPFHAVVSGNMMLLTVTGRKTGKTYSTPTNYVRDGNRLFVISWRNRSWWRNLLSDGASVRVLLQGHEFAGIGRAIVDKQAVAENLCAYFRRVPQWAKYSDVTLDANGEPTAESIARAAESRVMVEIELR